jgi:hypothetical protein
MPRESLGPLPFVLNVGRSGTVPSAEFRKLPRVGLYVISHDGLILRVGESFSGETRLKKGFREPLRRRVRGKERKNYIAYAWRDDYRGEHIKIDYFELRDRRFRKSHFRRALEAEVAFLGLSGTVTVFASPLQPGAYSRRLTANSRQLPPNNPV